ncbi:MAG TPA: prolyl oligopeptidase family serine peptidase, partial [Brevibacterium sp.]|nr:prolyl oligopeptidase family serine peptidase [Brevibacterium sp.]
TRLSLLDRGVVIAIAHVRGGGEMGRDWYEHGRLLEKKNSFTDFVAAAEHLGATGLVDPARLGAEGRSAGGLLMGAVANLAPERFRAIIAGVPFVDTLTTILDPSLPLTVGEWEEWGDPLHDPQVYAYMKEYTPYENVRAVEYPAIFASTSLNDTRVFFVEPAKWVARLRETVTSDQAERPIVFRCEMVAGHGGRSGRYRKWEQRADELAWLLDQLGATTLL